MKVRISECLSDGFKVGDRVKYKGYSDKWFMKIHFNRGSIYEVEEVDPSDDFHKIYVNGYWCSSDDFKKIPNI